MSEPPRPAWRRRRPLVATLLVVAAAGAAHADVVRLSRGRRIEGEIVEERASSVVVRAGGAVITIDRAEVVGIDRTPTPAQSLGERRARLTEGDAAGALALADAAAAAGVVDEEGEALKLAARWEKGGGVAASRLRAWTRTNVRLPLELDEEQRLVDDMGVPAGSYRSMHYAIAYDGELEEVRRTARALESVWRSIHALSDALGVEAKSVDRALCAQLFADFDAWAAALGRSPSELRDVVGVYVAPTRRLALHDAATRPHSIDLGRRLRLVRDELSESEAARLRLEAALRRFRQDVAYARTAFLSIRTEALRSLATGLDGVREAETRRGAALKSSLDALRKDVGGARIALLGDPGRRLQVRVERAMDDLAAESSERETLHAVLVELQTGLRARCEDGRVLLALEAWRGLEELVDPLAETALEFSSATAARRGPFESVLKDLDDAFAASNLAAASHAACVQLAIATGLHAVDDPIWLVEGLAAAFDAADGRPVIWEKPQIERLREIRETWREAGAGWLAPLVGGAAFSSDTSAACSGSYVLVWYLHRERPADLARFLKRDRKAAAAGDDSGAREFERHFGPLDEFETRLLAYLERR
jgi:hypothetical protein